MTGNAFEQCKSREAKLLTVIVDRGSTKKLVLARHLENYGTRPSVSRTGVRWDSAWAEVGGRDPQGTRGPIRWSTTARSKATRDTASQVDPGTHNQRQPHPAPRAQDTRRARPGAPSNKTTSPRHRFQSCPRHTQQPTQPPPLPVPTGLQASERLLHPMRTSRPPRHVDSHEHIRDTPQTPTRSPAAAAPECRFI